MSKIFLDADGEVLGRLGSFTAKALLMGNEVVIINSEKAIISGNKSFILAKIARWRKMGGSSTRGPMVPKSPERLLKRMIRGMLPWDRTRGVEAWKRLICHVGNPGEVKDAKKLNIKKPFKYMTLEEVCKILK